MTGYTEKLITTGDGSTHVLEKPFESSQLLRQVRQALKSGPTGRPSSPSTSSKTSPSA